MLTYLKTTKKTNNGKPVISSESKSISFTALEAPLQSLNIIYPYSELEKDNLDEDMLNYLYGRKGLARIMKYTPKTKRDFLYKDVTLKNFGEFLRLKILDCIQVKLHIFVIEFVNQKALSLFIRNILTVVPFQ